MPKDDEVLQNEDLDQDEDLDEGEDGENDEEDDNDEEDEEDDEDEDEDEDEADEAGEDLEDEDEDEDIDPDYAEAEPEPVVLTVAAAKLDRLIREQYGNSGRAFARAHGLYHSEINLMRRGARNKLFVQTAYRIEQLTNGYVQVYDWLRRA